MKLSMTYAEELVQVINESQKGKQESIIIVHFSRTERSLNMRERGN